MNKFKFILILFLISSEVSWSQGIEEFSKELQNRFNIEEFNIEHLKDSEFKLQTKIIFTILSNVNEVNIHQLHGEVKNKVYLLQDGHKEAVYDEDGKLVNDCPNMGTYNYYNPSKTPLGHFAGDILPWLLLGSCRDDTSTIDERIEAYILDLKAGLMQVQNGSQEFFLPQKFRFNEYGQSISIGFFLKALETSNFDLNTKILQDEKGREEFYEAIEKGFKQLLKNTKQ